MSSVASATEKGVVRPARAADRQRIAELAYLESFVHQHPGWFSPIEAVNERGFVVLESKNKLLAALSLQPENRATAWVRLFAANINLSPKQAWERLWDKAVQEMRESGIRWIAAMPFEEWFRALVAEHGFVPYQTVEVLVWKPQPLPEAKKAKGYHLRNMTPADLPEVAEIDSLSFGEFWSTNQKTLAEGLRRSVWARVVEEPNSKQLVGFQISTASPLGGHLARIAVHPKAQRKGLGYWLVHDVLTFFSHQNAEQVTLNTQGNNAVALGLYKRLGFRPTEEKFPVLYYSLDGTTPPSGGNM